ncbi:MAG: Eco57I restriction-modification methylase domain-containing protein [Mogibacterium sp.]|nr:Eco57I restriction-modification methylase domain-containing protein [Mogibacterium sp.]
MKFDFAIGNPPYQETVEGTSDAPVYHEFMDAAYSVADKVELITPARFLFNAGKTPKAWNNKMLNDEHFKVLQYEADATKVFPNTSINGGVAITYRDSNKSHEAIGIFTAFEQLNDIVARVDAVSSKSLADIAFSPETYGFTEVFHKDFPFAEDRLSDGHSNDIVTNVFEKLPEAFAVDADNKSFARFLGRADNKRAYRFINKKYIEGPTNFSEYKVFIPKSDGAAGTVGKPIPARISGMPILGMPYDGHTQTFMSIGSFDTQDEAENLLKYMKTKFTRCLLGVLKVTQHNPPEKWKHVPLQDFTNKSDIDWSVSIKNIDKQLYRKYKLTDDEIEFIETHVKEME